METTACPSTPHTHVTPDGILVRCYHKCKTIFSWQFFVGMTLSFPVEHWLWTQVPGFSHIAKFMGL